MVIGESALFHPLTLSPQVHSRPGEAFQVCAVLIDELHRQVAGHHLSRLLWAEPLTDQAAKQHRGSSTQRALFKFQILWNGGNCPHGV